MKTTGINKISQRTSESSVGGDDDTGRESSALDQSVDSDCPAILISVSNGSRSGESPRTKSSNAVKGDLDPKGSQHDDSSDNDRGDEGDDSENDEDLEGLIRSERSSDLDSNEDEWDNDDDIGYLLVPLSEEEFYEMEDNVSCVCVRIT